jgi:hypothetical protein
MLRYKVWFERGASRFSLFKIEKEARSQYHISHMEVRRDIMTEVTERSKLEQSAC